ncbi:MAG: hypothetical protein ACOYMA_16620 [Bacteroidia bacterium]
MANIERNRIIRPSSRLETSKSYKIDTKNVTKEDSLTVNIGHETKSFNKTYCFKGSDIASKKSISFSVKDYGTHIDINWSGVNPIKTNNSKYESKLIDNGTSPLKLIKVESKSTKDEEYVINLCDKVLGLSSSRQHTFDFLFGDKNEKGNSKKLPVDSYFKEVNLVVEYCERQHTEIVNFFDKPNKMTISGVHRGEQRKIYDERRRQVLQQNKIELIEISYLDFKHDKQKRILRNVEYDIKVVELKLNSILKK